MRKLLALMLLFAATLPPAPARVSAREQDVNGAAQGAPAGQRDAQPDDELTPDGEREARELAVRLMKRLRETDDFDPVVSEFLPADFAERVRRLVRDQNAGSEFFAFCAREVLLNVSAEDLRRTYVVLMNFWNQQYLLDDAAWGYAKVQCATEGRSAAQDCDAWPRHQRLKEEAVPEEAYRIAQGDPLLDGLFNFLRHDEDEEEAGGEDSEDAAQAKLAAAVIRDVARLRAFTDRLERCVPLLRQGVEKLRAELKTLAAVHGVSGRPEEYEPIPGDPFRVYKLESAPLEAEGFGLPAGTLLIRARISPYEMALARVGGQLKVIAVYPDFDGD